MNIIDEEFPADHPLYSYTRCSTVIQSRVSYSCMPNIKQTIDGHNKSTLSTIYSTTSSLNMCSCPKKDKELCPLSNKCITESVVGLYQATVTILRTKLQIDLPKHMSDLQKTRLKQDLQTIKHLSLSFDKPNATKLTKYVWELKNQSIDYTIKWTYNCASNRCM